MRPPGSSPPPHSQEDLGRMRRIPSDLFQSRLRIALPFLSGRIRACFSMARRVPRGTSTPVFPAALPVDFTNWADSAVTGALDLVTASVTFCDRRLLECPP